MNIKELRKILSILQKAMVERGISENANMEDWCPYKDREADEVTQKTIGKRHSGWSWRTESSLWMPKDPSNPTAWTFKNHYDLTYKDIKLFCQIHDIMNLVPPEIYGEKRTATFTVATEVEFMDI